MRTSVRQALTTVLLLGLVGQALAQQGKPTLHVLAIGINSYPKPLQITTAVDDAKGIAAAFQKHSKALFDVRTTLLLDKDATRAGILKALEELPKRCKAGDLAVVVFAGASTNKDLDQLYIPPVDVQLAKVKETSIAARTFRDHLAKVPTTVLFILDGCHAGAFEPSENTVLLAACGKDEEANEDAKLGHGYFSLAVIEGLGGKARAQKDGTVSLTGLQAYVEERVEELSKKAQYPSMKKSTSIRSFPLSKP